MLFFVDRPDWERNKTQVSQESILCLLRLDLVGQVSNKDRIGQGKLAVAYIEAESSFFFGYKLRRW